jgi:hypothetical protein
MPSSRKEVAFITTEGRGAAGRDRGNILEFIVIQFKSSRFQVFWRGMKKSMLLA